MKQLKTKEPISKILIIEDYESAATVTSMYLEQCGYECDLAQNGIEAIKKFQKEDYCAILMDVRMPGLDGHQTTEAIRLHEKNVGRPATRIIGVTGLDRPIDKQKCLESGMDDYLCKPYDLAELREKLASQPNSHMLKH